MASCHQPSGHGTSKYDNQWTGCDHQPRPTKSDQVQMAQNRISCLWRNVTATLAVSPGHYCAWQRWTIGSLEGGDGCRDVESILYTWRLGIWPGLALGSCMVGRASQHTDLHAAVVQPGGHGDGGTEGRTGLLWEAKGTLSESWTDVKSTSRWSISLNLWKSLRYHYMAVSQKRGAPKSCVINRWS